MAVLLRVGVRHDVECFRRDSCKPQPTSPACHSPLPRACAPFPPPVFAAAAALPCVRILTPQRVFLRQVSSTMVPLLLPFGVFYFAVKTGIDKYNFLYVWPYHAGTGLLALTAMHCLGIGLLIMQFCMLGFFLYWGTTWQFILVAILFAVTAMWSANWILSAPWVALLRKADDKRPAVFPFHEGIESPRFYNPLAQDGDDKTV